MKWAQPCPSQGCDKDPLRYPLCSRYHGASTSQMLDSYSPPSSCPGPSLVLSLPPKPHPQLARGSPEPSQIAAPPPPHNPQRPPSWGSQKCVSLQCVPPRSLADSSAQHSCRAARLLPHSCWEATLSVRRLGKPAACAPSLVGDINIFQHAGNHLIGAFPRVPSSRLRTAEAKREREKKSPFANEVWLLPSLKSLTLPVSLLAPSSKPGCRRSAGFQPMRMGTGRAHRPRGAAAQMGVPVTTTPPVIKTHR